MKPLCAHCTWWTSPREVPMPKFEHCNRCGAPVPPTPPPPVKHKDSMTGFVLLLVCCAAGGAAVGLLLQALGMGL